MRYTARACVRDVYFQRTRNRHPPAACKLNNETLIHNMKKTLITLLALGGLALGDTLTLNDALATGTGGNTIDLDSNYTEKQTNFTLTLNLDAQAFIRTLMTAAPTETSTWIAQINTEYSSGSLTSFGPAICYVSSSNDTDAILCGGYLSYGLKGKSFNLTNDNSGLITEATSNWGYNATTGNSSIIHAALTVTGTIGSNLTAYLTVQKEDGTTFQYQGTTTGYTYDNVVDINSISLDENIVEKAYLFNSIATESQVMSMHLALVPEPSTATLSLLALAGLCARRRRH